MAEHLGEHFIDLSRWQLRSHGAAELGLNHLHGGLRVAAAVVVREKVIALEREVRPEWLRCHDSRRFSVVEQAEGRVRSLEQNNADVERPLTEARQALIARSGSATREAALATEVEDLKR